MTFLGRRHSVKRFLISTIRNPRKIAPIALLCLVTVTITQFYSLSAEIFRADKFLRSIQNDIDSGIIPKYLSIQHAEKLLYGVKDLERIQKLRVNKIKDYCNKHPEFSTSLNNDEIKQALAESHFHKYGLFYNFLEPYRYYECRVAKASTTARSFILWKAFHTGKNITTSVYYHPTMDPDVVKMDRLPPEKLHHALSTYFGAIFVRDPIDKIISAYFNKFCDPAQKWEFKARFGIETPGTPTLGEVLKVLANEDLVYFNEEDDHFTSYFRYCNPCLSNFSFVGRFETHSADLDYMVHNKTALHRGMSYAIHEAPVSPPFHDCPYDRNHPEAFKDVDIKDIYRLIKKHQHDYAAFGYDPGKIIEYVRKRIAKT